METELNPSQKKEWFGNYVPKHTAKLIKDSFEKNESPLLPNKDGIIEPNQIINANNGWVLNAKDLIPAQITKQNASFESYVVGTRNSLTNAGVDVKENEKGLYFNFKNDKGEYHSSLFYFPEQTSNPKKLVELAQSKEKSLNGIQKNLKDITLNVDSANDYLAKYMVANKSGAKIKVSPEVVNQFKENMLEICNNELKRTTAEKNPVIPKLNDVLFNADKKANELIKNINKERGIGQNQKEIKPKQNNRKPIEIGR